MAIPKPITRVEQYLAHISGMRVNVPEAPLTREERYLAAWAKKSGIEDAEIQGDPPLTLKDCIGEPFKGLTLYGKSTQVTTTGAQLLNIPDYTGTSRGVKVTVKEGLVSLHGTCTETGWVLIERVTPVSLDGVYSLSVYGASRRVTLVTENYLAIMDSTSASAVNNIIAKKLAFTGRKGEVLNVDGIKVMLNAGDTALPWEPYTSAKPTPSPDYPQEIKSAGDDGNVAVSVTGKNLLDISKAKTSSLATSLHCNITPKNGCIKISGNVTKESYISFAPNIIPIGEKVFLFLKTEESTHFRFRIAYQKESEESVSYVYDGEGFLRENTSYKTLVIQLIVMPGKFDAEVYPMITTEKDATFEPYKGEQLITFSTPNGLPGIPVDSGGNYTDSTGQQWICDEVDLERGVYVQRIYTVDIAELEYSASTILQTVKRIFYKISMPSTGTTNKGYCTRLTYSANYTADNPHFYINEERIVVFIPLDTTIKPKEYLVQYVLATPIETPLSETDIAAYRALTTYRGTTILESECGLKVIYSKLRRK